MRTTGYTGACAGYQKRHGKDKLVWSASLGLNLSWECSDACLGLGLGLGLGQAQVRIAGRPRARGLSLFGLNTFEEVVIRVGSYAEKEDAWRDTQCITKDASSRNA